ncbi:DUF6194 family protein [Streptomyces sp. NPDC032940]|uniref:DUF6194 family protein n=1 Tax=Streptomyces sp. NPDC032940 TaxID=3155366 RepID=UPI0033C0B0CF
MEQIIAQVRAFDGALVLLPERGGDFPEVAWGDAFFYHSHSPDGRVPHNVQPYATIVTKDYPGDTASDLDRPGRWRVNIHLDRATFQQVVGEAPRGLSRSHDYAAADTIVPHPVYGELGWISVVAPGERTAETVLRLLRGAHDAAGARSARRQGRTASGD